MRLAFCGQALWENPANASTAPISVEALFIKRFQMALRRGLLETFPVDDDPTEEKHLELGRELKDEDEIRRFTIREDVSEQEKALMFLNGGHPTQQLWTIERLPTLLGNLKRAEYEPILEALRGLFSSLDAELQAAVGEILVEIVKEDILTAAEVSQWISPLVRDVLSGPDDSAKTDAWFECLRELLPLAKDDVLEEILHLASRKGGVEEAVEARIVCSKLLGCFADATCDAVKTETLLRLVKGLCQDTDYEVRLSICSQLPRVLKALHNPAAQTEILTELSELLSDEKASVRVEALDALVASLPILSVDILERRVLPVVKSYLQPRDLDPEMQICFARLFGKLTVEMSRCFKADGDGSLFFSCYRFLASRKDHELRLNSARQFSAMLYVAGGLKYPAYFHDTFVQLAGDTNEDVRVVIAAQFGEVAKMLSGDVGAQYLSRILANLMNDAAHAVQQRILPSLRDVLERMEFLEDRSRREALEPIVERLREMLKSTGRNWRLHETLITTITQSATNLSSLTEGSSRLTGVLEAEMVYVKLVPLVFESLLSGTASVCSASAKCLATVMRTALTEKQRTALYTRLLREHWGSSSCRLRMHFLDVAVAVLTQFSAHFFKSYFLDFVVDLLYDAVPNVRLQALTLLPRLKQTIELPQDVQRLERLNNAMSHLMMDRDADVGDRARSVHTAFKQLPIRMAGGAGVLDMNGAAGGLSKFEAEDSRKAQEETEITLQFYEAELLRAEREGEEGVLRLRNTRVSSDFCSQISFASAKGNRATDKPAATLRKSPSGEPKVRGRTAVHGTTSGSAATGRGKSHDDTSGSLSPMKLKSATGHSSKSPSTVSSTPGFGAYLNKPRRRT